MSLIATLTLDSSEYMEGLEEAKRAATEAGQSIKQALNTGTGGSGNSGGSGGSGGGSGTSGGRKTASTGGSSAAETANSDPVVRFLEYITQHGAEVTTAAGALELAARAFADASKGTSAEGIGAFVEYLADHKDDFDKPSNAIATVAGALGTALQTSDNPMAKGAGIFIKYLAEHKDDLTTPAGAVTTLAGALGEALSISDDPLAKGAGKFLNYIADHKEDFNSVAGVITTLAGGLGEAMKDSDNEGVALAGDFLSYMAQNASNLTSPVGVIMTLLVYLVSNWDTISSFFSSVAPQWLLDLPGNITELWQGLLNIVNDALTQVQAFIDKLTAFFTKPTQKMEDMDPEEYAFWENAEWNGSEWVTPHAAGLDYVPRNGYRAMLHEGEAVLNKEDATAWRRGNGGATAAEIAAAVYDVFEGMGVVMDGQTVGRLTAQTVSRELERSSRAGRFAAM